MLFSDQITLRNSAPSISSGFSGTSPPKDTIVWANVASVTRSEFYAANANGIDAVIAFEVHVEDWGGQNQVVYNSKVYYIIRTYQKGLGVVVLNCSDKAVGT